MSRVPLFASLLSVTASCGLADDEIWMPPSSGGKADGVSILEGSDIPSQHVDATKHYLTGRTIESLRAVGALTGVAESVATRADGIIANLPANGRLEAAELVRLEDAAIFATLFPDEQAELPGLWPHLLAPAPGATPVPSPAGDLTVTEQLLEPSGLTPPPSIVISSLPSQLQNVAKRVQLVFNGDSNSATIQTADIDAVLANPAAFTPAEVQQLRDIVAIFHERSTSVEDATLIVPMPGHAETTTNIGALALKLEADVVLHERRHLDFSQWGQSWSGELRVEQDLAATLSGGSGDHVILLQLGSNAEHVLTGPTASVPALAASEYVVERYTSGQRQETHAVATPAFTPGHTNTKITQFLDYTMKTANNTTLVKNPISTTTTTVGNQTTYQAEYRFGPTTVTAPNIHQGVLDELAMPALPLPTGRYEIRLPRLGYIVTLDLYPQHVVIAKTPSLVRLAYANTGWPWNGKALAASLGGATVRFDLASKKLSYSGHYQSDEVIVTPAMRVK